MITAHTTFAILALVIGPLVFLRRKGDRRHRWLGRSFAIALLGVILTAFGIYELTGGPNHFHALALLSLWTLWRGVIAIRRGDVASHLAHMAFAYAGLIAALGSRLPLLLPSWPYGLATAVGIALPLIVTELVVRWRIRRLPDDGEQTGQLPAT